MTAKTPEQVADYLWECLTITLDGHWYYKGTEFIRFQGKRQRGVRVAHLLWVGPIPDGHEVAQSCAIRDCIRPVHLITQPRHTALDTWNKRPNRNDPIPTVVTRVKALAPGELAPMVSTGLSGDSPEHRL